MYETGSLELKVGALLHPLVHSSRQRCVSPPQLRASLVYCSRCWTS